MLQSLSVTTQPLFALSVLEFTRQILVPEDLPLMSIYLFCLLLKFLYTIFWLYYFPLSISSKVTLFLSSSLYNNKKPIYQMKKESIIFLCTLLENDTWLGVWLVDVMLHYWIRCIFFFCTQLLTTGSLLVRDWDIVPTFLSH